MLISLSFHVRLRVSHLSPNIFMSILFPSQCVGTGSGRSQGQAFSLGAVLEPLSAGHARLVYSVFHAFVLFVFSRKNADRCPGAAKPRITELCLPCLSCLQLCLFM
jgi:hypothetical protein